MGEGSKIDWTDHTWNPWQGCEPVSPGCEHCYAAAMLRRWGKDPHERVRTGEANWRKPLVWNRKAAAGEIGQIGRRVFCGSMCDVFDQAVPIEWLSAALHVIGRCTELRWLLLTKRPELIQQRIGEAMDHRMYWGDVGGPGDPIERWVCGEPPAHVWLGTSVEHQSVVATRIPALLGVPAHGYFLSCEPLLGALDLHIGSIPHCAIDWVIVGGERGPGARRMEPEWVAAVADQCARFGVPFFHKQWGTRLEREGAGPLLRREVPDALV